jgi:predicted ester cyclase
MRVAAHEDLIRRWFEEVWNQSRAATIDELMSDDMVIHGHNPPLHGRDGFRNLHVALCAALPDIRITPDLVFSADDLVVAHNIVEGTHKGELFGVPPSNKRVRFTGTSIARVRKGKFVEAWDEYNFLELYGQLDALDHVSAMRKSASR